MPNITDELPPIDREQAVEATAWFSALMLGAHTRDLRSARQARSELERRGVLVRFQRQRGDDRPTEVRRGNR
jgi:hypothetical protein